MSTPVLVSSIMPTHNRRVFVPRAIAYFLRQDYPDKELVIVDNGPDLVEDLVPADPRIRYLRCDEQLSIGAKRNLACQQARGEIILHWDDDDWMADWRISYQVESLLKKQADICGLSNIFYYHPAAGRAWRYVYPDGGRQWVGGNTLCYRKSVWQENAFPNINVGEDTRFVWGNAAKGKKIVALPDSSFFVAMIHDGNVSPKRTQDARYHPCVVEEIRQAMGSDWSYYHPHQALPAQPESAHLDSTRLGGVRAAVPSTASEEGKRMMIAKHADLSLPEYKAFNHEKTLPRMRQWELPFALFQARLGNAMSVLDCTINPASFDEQLRRLYPHVLYRHWNPIQQGRFQLPLGVPDEAFDRVFCINTLEHLLAAQREKLVAEMARKLKPGGLLILTSDYYFDSFWQNPAILKMGVVRVDRGEVFNGWNKVTPAGLELLCMANGLLPAAEGAAEPREGDPTLYLNLPPYPHACAAGVYQKAAQVELPPGKKIMLALLVWNTREVSIDSVRAHLEEARMLRRLGQQPFLCICDNGSTDGMAAALRAMEPEIDVPYKLILNPENLGNSVARNQIVDYFLECGADYLLFLDGDIELVPFSSFAMVRHLENNGRRLGCIGANSGWQSTQRARAATSLFSVGGMKIETGNIVAWTQYGMFRREVFADGVRFDESGPFNGAGWGFEDNDLAFQMEMKGYVIQCFNGMTYLHRDARSSIRNMRAQGIDAAGLFARRRQHLLDKWSPVPAINDGPLSIVRRFTRI